MPRLSPQQREHFEREGYVVLHEVLDPIRDFAPVFSEWQQVLDGIAEVLYASGEITDTYRNLPFARRLMAIAKESGQTFVRHFDPSLPERNIQPNEPIDVGPAMFGLLRNERLIDIVCEFIGQEVYSSPIQHIRIKYPESILAGMPRNGLTHVTQWHQDNGVVLPEADETRLLTVWIPLTRASAETGCLVLIPGSHRRGLVAHCPTTLGLGLSERALGSPQPKPIPMAPGSILFMNKLTMHASLANVTESEVRISLDLRYQPTGQPTGRPGFPGFVARSAADPHRELRDPVAWAESWYAARRRVAAASQDQLKFHRWDGDSELCA
jgi:phytanoyl-CoA hydroxylase